MKVRTLRAHDNEFGGKYHKAKGSEYEINDDPLAGQMITDGLIEEVSDGDGKDGGTAGAGRRTGAAT